MTQILLIDDDPSLHRLLGQYLEESGYEVLHAGGADEGLRAMYEHRPDLVLLDVMMPGMDGWEVGRRMRALSDLPLIFLTAKGETADRVMGFKLGADDFVAKPFSFAELTARIEAVLRRAAAGSGEPEPSATVTTRGRFTLDGRRRLLLIDGTPTSLTPIEYRLAEAFMNQPGVVLSPQQLAHSVWSTDTPDASYIRRYVFHLRQLIEPDPSKPRYLLTERGFGYHFEPD